MRARVAASALLSASLLPACGSSGPDPTPPSPRPSDPPMIVTITAAGVDPQVLHVFDVTATITVVNNDSRVHDLMTDPHPAHTLCPASNLGPLMPGQSRQITTGMPRGTACYYHDETDPPDRSFQGLMLTH